jgi:hypothetical protein
MNSRNFGGLDPLCCVVCQFRRDHCSVEFLAMSPLSCFVVFYWWSGSIVGSSGYSDELIDYRGLPISTLTTKCVFYKFYISPHFARRAFIG